MVDTTLPAEPATRTQFATRLPLLVPAAASALLGVVGTLRVHLWRDEFATVQASALSWSDLVRSLGHVDLVLSPYYLLMRLLAGFGLSGAGLRVPSVLAAVGAVALLTALASRWWGTGPAVVAGLALAVNPLFVQLSVDARPYTLATFFVLLSTVLLVRAVDGEDAGRSWFGYAACLLVAGLLHPFAVLAVLAQIALVVRRRPGALRVFGVCVGVVAVLLAPLVLASQSQRDQVGWIVAPTPTRAVGTLFNVLDYQRGGDVQPSAVVAAVLFVAAVGLVLRAARTARLDGSAAPWERQAWFALALFAGPWLVLLVVSVVLFPVLTSHYLAVSPPGAALVFGLAVHVLGRSTRERAGSDAAGRSSIVAFAAGLAVLVALAPTAVSFVVERSWQDDFPGLASDLSANVRTGDVVVIVQKFDESGFAAGVAHYTGDRTMTADLRRRLPAGRQPAVDARLVVATDPLTTRAITVAAPGRRVWLVSVAGSRPPASIATVLRRIGCPPGLPPLTRRDHGGDRVQQLACART